MGKKTHDILQKIFIAFNHHHQLLLVVGFHPKKMQVVRPHLDAVPKIRTTRHILHVQNIWHRRRH